LSHFKNDSDRFPDGTHCVMVLVLGGSESSSESSITSYHLNHPLVNGIVKMTDLLLPELVLNVTVQGPSLTLIKTCFLLGYLNSWLCRDVREIIDIELFKLNIYGYRIDESQ
jgi:hypothetical protein